ncbi:MAG: HAD-IA family hydrolase [Betaproteobacteria bacterium]|nr:HAD-IA family hydrolase [Betaproteobacteria bacterium]
MAKRFELIVFDWDGTLMDSAGAIVTALQKACRDLEIEPPSDEMARHIIGLGLQDALREALPELPSQRYRELSERYRYHFLAHDHELALFEGAFELIGELGNAGFLLAVATGKTRTGLDRAMRSSGLQTSFHASRCADECHSKPHPQMLLELMEEFSVAPENTLMIGDTTHDLLMARNANVPALAVAYGAHPRSVLEAEKPLECAASVAEMSAWLTRNA